MSLRQTSIRLNNDLFLKSFVKIGMSDVPDFRLLHAVEKELSSKMWAEINMLFFNFTNDKDMVTSENLRIDTTVSETNIHHPSDSHLLWDAFRVLSKTIRPYLIKNPRINILCRFHLKKVRKLYTFISRNAGNKSKRTQQKIKTAYRELMNQVSRIIALSKQIEAYGEGKCGKSEFRKICHYWPLAVKILNQAQKRILEKVKVPAGEKIYSLFEEHTELIKRGKAGKTFELGHMITIAQTKEKFITFYDCLETRESDKNKIDKLLGDHKKRFGCNPKGLATDKGFYENMDKIKELAKDITTVSIAKKGRRTALEKQREHGKKFKELQKFRAGVEGSISVLKRVFSMDMCLLRTFKNFAARIGHIIFCHNLRLVADMIT
jgi:IS5 family transposase